MSALASSEKFRTFSVVFAITGAALYVICDFAGLPLFTFHPATGRLEWGYTLPRRGEGPVMYWYGWTATTLIGATIVGGLATLLPAAVARRIPLFLIWLLPIVAIPLLFYSLMSFWTR
jgi:hypothetical protein